MNAWMAASMAATFADGSGGSGVGNGAGEAGEAEGVGDAGGEGLAAAAARARSRQAATRTGVFTGARTSRPGPASLQPIAVLQLLGQVLLGDEADAAAGQRFQLELEPALHHLLDLALPAGVFEPGIGEHLFGPAVVAIVHLDGDVCGQLVLVLVEGGETDEPGVGHGHAHGFVGQVDRTLLHDAVDVETPGVVVDEHIDGQFQLVVQPLDEPTNPARWLSLALNDDAVVALPELVLVEA